MRVELDDCTNTLLREIASQEMKQKDVGLTYALAIRSDETTDWAKVNEAIVSRWSLSGLERVKKMAWKRLEGGTQGGK